VAFTGRINQRDRDAKRFTQSDLAHCISDQTGITDKYKRLVPAVLHLALFEIAFGAPELSSGPT